MNKGLSVILIVVGIIMIVYGNHASNSLSSDFSRFFNGTPTDKTVWLLIGGIVATAAGVFGLFRGSK